MERIYIYILFFFKAHCEDLKAVYLYLGVLTYRGDLERCVFT